MLEYDYPENGTDPVATFSASDPEDGDAISSGRCLAVSTRTDFDHRPMECSPSRARPTSNFEAKDARYNVTVEATGGSVDGGGRQGELAVVNLNDGRLGERSTSRSLRLRQRPCGQWSLTRTAAPRRGSGSGPVDDHGETGWTDIDGATIREAFAGRGGRGYYLRATVTYTDMFGDGQTDGPSVSDNAVEARTTGQRRSRRSLIDDNDEDSMPRHPSGARKATPKGHHIGEPVMWRGRRQRRLLYELWTATGRAHRCERSLGQTDDEKFDIDERTGQLKVKDVLNFEAPGPAGIPGQQPG